MATESEVIGGGYMVTDVVMGRGYMVTDVVMGGGYMATDVVMRGADQISDTEDEIVQWQTAREIVNEIPAEETGDTPNIEDAQVKSDIEEEYLTWQTEKKSVEENEICLQSIKIPPILQKRG
ncbi:hypothetical protein EMCRGX_G019002 [Ephydatia muelleri]